MIPNTLIVDDPDVSERIRKLREKIDRLEDEMGGLEDDGADCEERADELDAKADKLQDKADKCETEVMLLTRVPSGFLDDIEVQERIWSLCWEMAHLEAEAELLYDEADENRSEASRYDDSAKELQDEQDNLEAEVTRLEWDNAGRPVMFAADVIPDQKMWDDWMKSVELCEQDRLARLGPEGFEREIQGLLDSGAP